MREKTSQTIQGTTEGLTITASWHPTLPCISVAVGGYEIALFRLDEGMDRAEVVELAYQKLNKIEDPRAGATLDFYLREAIRRAERKIEDARDDIAEYGARIEHLGQWLK